MKTKTLKEELDGLDKIRHAIRDAEAKFKALSEGLPKQEEAYDDACALARIHGKTTISRASLDETEAELLRLKNFVPTATKLLASESVRIALAALPSLEKAASLEVQQGEKDRDAAYVRIAEAVASLAPVVGKGQACNAIDCPAIRDIAEAKDLPKTGRLDLARVFQRDMGEVRSAVNSSAQKQIQTIQWLLQKHLGKEK